MPKELVILNYEPLSIPASAPVCFRIRFEMKAPGSSNYETLKILVSVKFNLEIITIHPRYVILQIKNSFLVKKNKIVAIFRPFFGIWQNKFELFSTFSFLWVYVYIENICVLIMTQCLIKTRN